jgi:hypothetical protein
MTYRHGYAPADAPVTWLLIADKHGFKWQLTDDHGWICIAHSEELAERTARAFHWAKLFGGMCARARVELDDGIGKYNGTGLDDWCADYDARIKGDGAKGGNP